MYFYNKNKFDQYGNYQETKEVIDDQQRLKCIFDFLDNGFQPYEQKIQILVIRNLMN